MKRRTAWALVALFCTTACEDFACCETDGGGGGTTSTTPGVSQVAIRNCIEDRIVAIYKITNGGTAEYLGDLATSWPATESFCNKSSNGIMMVDFGNADNVTIHALAYPQFGSNSSCLAAQYDVSGCDDWQRGFEVNPDGPTAAYEIR